MLETLVGLASKEQPNEISAFEAQLSMTLVLCTLWKAD
jgi:hypothetical protein